jgi:hypothetical protein
MTTLTASLGQKLIRLARPLVLFLSLTLVSHSATTAQTPVDISFRSQGNLLQGKFFPGSSGPNQPSIILLPGFPGNEKDVIGLGKTVSESGFNVLVFNYSGTYRSEGTFTFETVLTDVKSAFDYVHGPEVVLKFHVDTTKLVLGGYSFGGGMALIYAASHLEVQHVFSIAGTDHGEFAREYRRNEAMAAQLDSEFEQLKRPNGPINFEGKAALRKLADDPSAVDLRLAAPKLVGRDILLIGGLDDVNVTVENHLLPFYRALKKANVVNVKFITLQTDHSFRNVRDEVTTHVVHWIQSAEASRPAKRSRL